MLAKQDRKYFTYADYCTWDDEPRCELVDGEIYLMASPSTKHQDILGNLVWKFREHLHGKKCRAFADLDVRLTWNKTDDTIFRPDLLVVCDPSKIGESYIKGAPDLVIEILSPSTSKHDITTKFVKYRQAAVKELWIVDPALQTVMVYKWENGAYIADNYGPTDKITVGILPELTIDLTDIFEQQDEGEIS